MPQVVTIGEILVEIMATEIGQTFLEPGLFAGPYPSGAPAIFADQAARVGATTAMIGCVGPDDFGTLNLERLRGSGVDVRRDPARARHDDRQRLRHLPRTMAAATSSSTSRTRPLPRWTPAQLEPGPVRGLPLLPRHGHLAVQRRHLRRRAARRRAGPGRRRRRSRSTRTSARSCWRCPTSRPPSPPCSRVTDLLLPSEADLAHLCPGQPEDEAARGLLAAGRRIVLLKKGDARQRLLRRRAADRDAGLRGRGGRPDRGRGLLRRHVRRRHGAGRAGASARCCWPTRRARWRWRRRGRWRATRPWPSSTPSWRAPDERAAGDPGRNRAGEARGIPSICSAHPMVLEACIDQAVADGAPLLVEATCNQVNQDGGYTGMHAGRLPRRSSPASPPRAACPRSG